MPCCVAVVAVAKRLARPMTVASLNGMVLCGHSDEFGQRYRGRIEKVKFGVPINEAFAHDIPATLLVLLLKVNKEGFMKKDIWRAPGNQAQVRKLSHVMQHGRLVNIANFSVYTAASVIKKFLSKLPGGIFGVDNEQTLFDSFLDNSDQEKQRQIFYRIFRSLPVPSQHLLVLLFGTFRMVADSADSYNTKMSPNAIAISVAPSLFHSCIHDGRHAKLEDVQRFKLASQVVQLIITSFGHTALFPRECYEFYARITGRTLRIDENYQFTFQYPSNLSSPAFSALAAKCAGAYSLAALHLEPDPDPVPGDGQAAPVSTASTTTKQALVQRTGSLHRHPLAHTTDHPKRPPAHALDVVDLKQSISWYFSRPEVLVYEGEATSSQEPRPTTSAQNTGGNNNRLNNRLSSSVGEVLHETSDVEDHFELEVLRPLTACAGDAGRSLSCLDWVHEKQARRMKSRSDWFLSPFISPSKPQSKSIDFGCTKNWTTTRENAPLLDNEVFEVVEKVEEESLPPTPKEKREPLVDRKNSLKEKEAPRRTLAQRQYSTGSSAVNIAGYTSPAVQSTPATAIARRRSWRMRCSQAEEGSSGVKTHSLDASYPPSELEQAAAKMEDWIKSSTADGVPPKRRSLKKKHTALF